MAGVSITFDTNDLNAALDSLRPVFSFDGRTLMTAIGAIGDEQTRRRITDEKAAPDGTPWKENAAKTPILQQTGNNLLSSIAFVADEDEAEWGATWEHAHVHQEGAVILPKTAEALRFQGPKGVVFAKKVTVPARPFVGLSDDNRAELIAITTDFLGRLVEDARR